MFGKIGQVLFVLYFVVLFINVYRMWTPPHCTSSSRCLLAEAQQNQDYHVFVYTSQRPSPTTPTSSMSLVYQLAKWSPADGSINASVEVLINETDVRTHNDSLYAHVILQPMGKNNFEDLRVVTPLVHFMPRRYRPRKMLIAELTNATTRADPNTTQQQLLLEAPSPLMIEGTSSDEKATAATSTAVAAPPSPFSLKQKEVQTTFEMYMDMSTALAGAVLILSASYFLHHPRYGGVSYVVLAVTTVAIFGHSILLRNKTVVVPLKSDVPIVITAQGPSVAHWIPELKVNFVDDYSDVPTNQPENADLIQLVQAHARIHDNRYSPVVYVDTLSLVKRSFGEMNENPETPNPFLNITINPVSLFWARGFAQIAESLSHMNGMGINEHDLDDLKLFFSKQRLHVLVLTYVISMLHMVFDFLAFKNDVGFYRKRKSFVGLSSRSIISSFICSLIIYLYLIDHENTSTMILGSIGLSTLIELWKIKRVLKIQYVWENGPWVTSVSSLERQTEAEKDTLEFDRKATQYLSMVMYPIVAATAVYNLVHYPQKSWWGWVIGSLAHGVYTFGFIMMTPQLFINYRLKSVAHLPWKVFMYKAFNTFIDDVFSFIVQMPMAHRIACLRDDLVFFVYLYQRWCYPVDMKRANEYGFSYEEEEGDTEKEHQESKKEETEKDQTGQQETGKEEKDVMDTKGTAIDENIGGSGRGIGGEGQGDGADVQVRQRKFPGPPDVVD